MSRSGFLCPKCNSWYTEYVGCTDIECNTCGYIWDPGADDDDDNIDLCCPRCSCDDLYIGDDGEFVCNGCRLEGNVEDIDD